MNRKQSNSFLSVLHSPQPEEIIAKRRERIEQRSSVSDFVIKLCVTAFSIWAVLTFIFGVAPMKGEGMYPRIRDGDLMIFYRIDKAVHLGDVLTFKRDGVRYTGRVVAVGGDSLDINEEGELLVNGNIQNEEVFYPTDKSDAKISLPCELAEDTVFLLDDMRTGAIDSREYGPVPRDEIDGKVISIIRRRGI